MNSIKIVPWNKPTCTWVIVSCSKINSSSFLVIIFTAVTERICIVFINVFFNTKCVISVTLCYFSVFISKVYYITVSILSIVSIFGLITVPIVVLSYKICTTNIAVSLVELVINYICYYLLISIPNMIYCLTVNSLFISQTACVVLIACSCFAISKADLSYNDDTTIYFLGINYL